MSSTVTFRDDDTVSDVGNAHCARARVPFTFLFPLLPASVTHPTHPVATVRLAQVFVKATALKAGECSETDIGDLEKLISEATKAVDKAVVRGVLHGNTGARRKSRMSKYKQELRKEKGLYTA